MQNTDAAALVALPDISSHVSSYQEVKQRNNLQVTNVKVETDVTEQIRRQQMHALSENTKQKLLNENNASSKKQAAINMQWSKILEIQFPLDMARELQQQKEQCQKVMDSKDKLIKELYTILRNKDEEYVKSLRYQQKDIEVIIQRMHTQHKEMTKEQEEQLGQIEQEFLKDRAALLQDFSKKLEDAKEKRRELERHQMESRREQVEKNEKELDELRDGELEKFAIKKKELDDEIHDLEQAIDSMRGVFQLSGETLQYCHNILIERVQENEAARRTNKTKLAKLQDQLTNIKAKYTRDDKKYKNTNTDLTESFKKLAQQYKELINKFQFFETHDMKQYEQIWKMNQEAAIELAEKALKADQIITEKQLGMKWIPPSEDIFQPKSQNSTLNSHSMNMERSGNMSDTGSFKTMSASVTSASGGVTEHQHPDTIAKILQLLSDNAGFLVEDKLRLILKKLSKEEGDLLKLDSILKSLGIESQDEIEKLMNYFVKEIKDIDELDQFDVSSNSHTDSDGCIIVVLYNSNQVVKLISPENVIHVLTKFVEDQQKASFTSNVKKKNKMASMEERRREKKRREEREYWQRLGEVVPEHSIRTWNMLEDAMEKYNALLVERSNIVEEVSVIKTQNEELKALLDHYMNQKINDELFISPTATLMNKKH